MHPAFRQLIDAKLANTRAPQWMLRIADVRRAFRSLWTPAMTGSTALIGRVEDVLIPSGNATIPARIYAPDRDGKYPVLVYLHGGGYVKGGLDECDVFCRNLSYQTRHLVVSVDYRLAPEHPFPAALDDAIAATVWACTHTADLNAQPGPVVICGESAGGNLAAATCLHTRLDPRMQIRYQVLLQPVLDFGLTCPSIAMRASDCLVPRDDLEWYYRTYAGDGFDPKDPRLSPLAAPDLSGLPPALIITAEYDTLRDEGEAYAQRLQAANVPTVYSCYAGTIHGFLQMGGLVQDAHAAIDEIARAIGTPSA